MFQEKVIVSKCVNLKSIQLNKYLWCASLSLAGGISYCIWRDFPLSPIKISWNLVVTGRHGLSPLLSPSHCSFHPITPFRTYLPNFKPGAQNIVGVLVGFNERGEGRRKVGRGCDQAALSFQMLINSALNFITKRDWKCRRLGSPLSAPDGMLFLGIHPRAPRSTLAVPAGFVGEGDGEGLCAYKSSSWIEIYQSPWEIFSLLA